MPVGFGQTCSITLLMATDVLVFMRLQLLLGLLLIGQRLYMEKRGTLVEPQSV
jgi:hypothetical protein